MKKAVIFSLSVLVFFTVMSCNKNGDDNPTIQGRWYAQTLKVQYYFNGASSPTATYDSTLAGTGYYEFSDTSTFSAKGEDGIVVNGTYTYDESSKKLVTTDGGAVTNYDVTTLTSGNMTLRYADTASAGGLTNITVYNIGLKK